MMRPDNCPQPIIVGGFDGNNNNTVEPGENAVDVESTFDVTHFTYAPRNEPSESNSSYKVKRVSFFPI